MQHNYILYINEFFKVIDLKYGPLESVNFYQEFYYLPYKLRHFSGLT